MIEIYNEDCLEGMKRIESESVDMILCDLPYGTTQCKWDTIIPFEPLWEQYNRIIKDNGAIVLFGTEPFSSHLRLSNLKMYKYDWIWNKNWPSGHLNAKRQPMRNHELISVFYKKQSNYNYIKQPRVMKEQTKKRHDYGYKINNGKSNVNCDTYSKYKEMSRMKEIDLELAYPTTIQKFDVIHRSKMLHQTQKPTDLLEYLIKTYTNEGEIILDNCMGSGSTAIASINTNRNFIGFELDEAYYKIACERIRA
jgi:site-specific DNA-methyltransferase (adenine-specific)